MLSDRALCQRSLYQFGKRAWSILEPGNPFVDGWHIRVICEHLEATWRRELRKLVINVPPRHEKSLLCAVFFFCWGWALDPTTRWLYSSYGQDLSSRDSVKCRDLITSPWYQERWGYQFEADFGDGKWGDPFKLKGDQNVKTWFANDKQGYRIATAVTGKATGHGGDFIVTDDPLNALDSTSAAERQRVIDWWTKSMSTRGNNPSTVCHLIVMQRLHEQDLTGYMLSRDLGYEHLCLPCQYEPARVYSLPPAAGEKLRRDAIIMNSLQRRSPSARDQRTREGELLWEPMFSGPQVADLRKTLGWAAPGQLDQRPSEPKGTIYQRAYFRYFTAERYQGRLVARLEAAGGDGSADLLVSLERCRWFQTVDTAETDDEVSAFSAVATWAYTPTRRLLLWHVHRERLQVIDLWTWLMSVRQGITSFERNEDGTSRVWRSGPDWPARLMFQAVEKASSGVGLLQQAAADGVPMVPLIADTDKVSRAGPAATMYRNGLVYHQAAEPWLTELEEELLVFPTGHYKDMADVVAYGGILATIEKLLTAPFDDDLILSPGQYDELIERREEYRAPAPKQLDEDGRRFVYGDAEITFED